MFSIMLRRCVALQRNRDLLKNDVLATAGADMR
jgi:hypothetical protein